MAHSIMFCFTWGNVVSSTTFWFIDLKPSRGDEIVQLCLRCFSTWYPSCISAACNSKSGCRSITISIVTVYPVCNTRNFPPNISIPERTFRKFGALDQVFTTKAKLSLIIHIIHIVSLYSVYTPYIKLSRRVKDI